MHRTGTIRRRHRTHPCRIADEKFPIHTLALILVVGFAALLLLGLAGLAREELDRRRDRELERLADDPSGIAGHVRVQDRTRRYYLHLPAAGADGSLALVMAFHGGRGNALKFADQTGFNAVADRHGFAVVYPEARGLWNDGRPESASRVNDVVFVRALIRHLVETAGVDPGRVYAVGASNGGMFTQRLACDLDGEVQAFASVMASMPARLHAHASPPRYVRMMMINGTDDPLVPWRGGQIGEGRRVAGGEVLSVEETVAFWVRHNGCRTDARWQSLPPRAPDDGTRVDILHHVTPGKPAEVFFVRIRGSGHTWPGSPFPVGPRREQVVGRTSYQIKASEMIWQFFSR